MTTKAAARADAIGARKAALLRAVGCADSIDFKVPSAPSILIHVEQNHQGRWSVTRYGWVQIVALTAQGWEPIDEVPIKNRFAWTAEAALLAVPDLLAEMEAEHAAWQDQRKQAERARQFAQVAEELLEPARDLVNLMKAGAA